MLEMGRFVDFEVENAGMLTDGASPNPQAIELNPAQRAARRMEKLIHDQLLDASAVSELRKGIFEQCLLGTGIVKGPFNHTKTIHKFNDKQIPNIFNIRLYR